MRPEAVDHDGHRPAFVGGAAADFAAAALGELTK
jgi:hypothetical protein